MTIAVDDRRLLLFGRPGWVFAGAAVDNFFSQGLYFGGGLSANYSVTRAQTVTSYATTIDGVLIPFAANVPRITNQGWLAEETRTNLVLFSQSYNASGPSGTNWNGSTNITRTDNTTAAPDGTTTASTLTPAATNTFHALVFNSNITVVSGSTYTWSWFVKPNGYNWVAVDAFSNGLSQRTWFNLTGAGSVGTNAAGNTSVITALANGWYRVSVTRATGSTAAQVILIVANGDAVATFLADGTSGVFAWGAQIELGGAVSSYIPTTTVAATRNGDNISLAGAASTILAAPQGSLVVWSTLGQTAKAGTLLDSNGTILLGETSGNALTTAITAGLTTGNTATWTGLVGSGLSWNAVGRTLILNNGSAATDAQVTTPATTFHLGSTSGSSAFFNGYIRRLAEFNSTLSASALGPNTVAK